MSELKIRLPYPHPGQQAVQRQARRFNWLSAGRRWRKTTLLMAIATEAALAGKVVLWGAPTHKQFLIAWDEFEHGCGDVASFKKGDQNILFPTGGKVFLRSLDTPDNARGYTADVAIIDEAGFVKEEAYYQIIRQMLIDTNGVLWAGGTPNGRNWFWREFVAAADREDSMAWQIPTVGCRVTVNNELIREPHPYENPDVPFSEIQGIFERTPIDLFKQEILAEFIEGGGSVFRNIAPNLTAVEGKPEDHKGHMVILTVDWAKYNDWTVVDVGCGDCKVELEMDRFNHIDYTFQRDRIKTLYDKWTPEMVIAEANAMGDPNIEMLWEDGIPVTKLSMTRHNKPTIIRSLAGALERNTWRFLDIPEATLELEAYEQRITQYGNSTYGAPKGLNDDTVVARALLVYGESAMGHVPLVFTD